MATFNTDDLVTEIAKLHPNLTEKSIKKIIDFGMRKLAWVLKRRFDVSLQIDRKNIFIYSPTTPEKQNKRMEKQYYRRQEYERRNSK